MAWPDTAINLDTPVPLSVPQHLGFEKVGPCPWRELLNKSLSTRAFLSPYLIPKTCLHNVAVI